MIWKSTPWEDSATCWVSFWDLNGPIIAALEQINGPASRSSLHNGGWEKCDKMHKGLIGTETGAVTLPEVFFFFPPQQNVCLWKLSAKWQPSFSYTWDTPAAWHAVNLPCHFYTLRHVTTSYCHLGCLEDFTTSKPSGNLKINLLLSLTTEKKDENTFI